MTAVASTWSPAPTCANWSGPGPSCRYAKPDGASKEPYDYVKDQPGLWLSRGAVATPTCMGFGPDEDHLVVLSDAGDPVKVVAFWRDEIPADASKYRKPRPCGPRRR